jgi:Flp pilus assembly protein TadD
MSLTNPTIANAISLATRIEKDLQVAAQSWVVQDRLTESVSDLIAMLREIANRQAQQKAVERRERSRK